MFIYINISFDSSTILDYFPPLSFSLLRMFSVTSFAHFLWYFNEESHSTLLTLHLLLFNVSSAAHKFYWMRGVCFCVCHQTFNFPY